MWWEGGTDPVLLVVCRNKNSFVLMWWDFDHSETNEQSCPEDLSLNLKEKGSSLIDKDYHLISCSIIFKSYFISLINHDLNVEKMVQNRTNLLLPDEKN